MFCPIFVLNMFIFANKNQFPAADSICFDNCSVAFMYKGHYRFAAKPLQSRSQIDWSVRSDMIFIIVKYDKDIIYHSSKWNKYYIKKIKGYTATPEQHSE